MANGKIIISEAQRSFLLSPAAKALRPDDAAKIKPDEAFERFIDIRFGWQDGKPECPTCGHGVPYVLNKRGRYPTFRCRRGCGDFSLTSGTVFSSRKAPLETILHAIAMRVHEPKNALQSSYDLGVTYKTAWNWAKQFNLFLGNIKNVRVADNRWPFVNSDRTEGHKLVTLVNGALPRTWPEQVRADVAQDMILGVLTGEISEADLERHVRRYITRHYKTVETKYMAVSLDQPVPGTDGQRWADRLPSGTEWGDRRYAD